MKLHCYVEIYDRSLWLKRKKSQRAILAFSKLTVKCGYVGLYLQTRQNVEGHMYKINKNIQQVFKRFITDGKATIRMIEPCHDLIIQSDVIQLKSFVHILEHIINGHHEHVAKYILISDNVPSFNKKEFFPLQKRKVIVKKKSDYPVLEGFPKITEELVLSGLGRMSFDLQILKLQSLRILDLSRNKISFLPKELGTLPHLHHLNMSENLLGSSPWSKWAWLEQTAIRNNLLTLDISGNSLQELPPQIGKLNSLTTLKVYQNMLEKLPQSIGCLQHLEYLDVSTNPLSCLPGTIPHLRLRFLNLSRNSNMKFHSSGTDRCIQIAQSMELPSLMECAAKSVIKSRLIYDASLIPFTLVRYLDDAKYCSFCKNACFNYYFRYFIYSCLNRMNINQIASPKQGNIGTDCYYCSLKCFQYGYTGKYIICADIQ